MVSGRFIYRMNNTYYGRYSKNGKRLQCVNCNLEILRGDGVVSRSSGRSAKRLLYCPFCAIEKNIALEPQVKDKLSPPEDWLINPFKEELNPDILDILKTMTKEEIIETMTKAAESIWKTLYS
jgi:hypothetical protein